MTRHRQAPQELGQGLLERRARKIALSGHVVLAISSTLIGLAIVGAVTMMIFDDENFPNFGIALWWAVQTFTTVGYGDVVPTNGIGRAVGGLVMVVGTMFISFLTAVVTSALVQRDRQAREQGEQAAREADLSAVVAGIARIEERLTHLERRLAAGD